MLNCIENSFISITPRSSLWGVVVSDRISSMCQSCLKIITVREEDVKQDVWENDIKKGIVNLNSVIMYKLIELGRLKSKEMYEILKKNSGTYSIYN